MKAHTILWRQRQQSHTALTPGWKTAGKVVHVDRVWCHPVNGMYNWGERKDNATECSGSDSNAEGDGDSDCDIGDEGLVAQNYHSVNGNNVDESEGENEGESESGEEKGEKTEDVATRTICQRRQPSWLKYYSIYI